MNWFTNLKESTENYGIYLVLGITAIIMVIASFFMQSFTFEILTSKIFNAALFGFFFWAIRRYDFNGKNFSFQEEVAKGNVSAGITLAGIAIALALLLSSVQ